MHVPELIRRKREGHELTEEEVHHLVRGIADGSVSDAQAAAFAMAVFFRGLDSAELSALTDAMLASGDHVLITDSAYQPTRRFAEVDEIGALAVFLAGPGGDSAGGNLATIVARRAAEEGGPEISLQVLVYPVTDADLDNASYVDPQNQLMLSRDSMIWLWDHYAPDLAQSWELRPDSTLVLNLRHGGGCAGRPRRRDPLSRHDAGAAARVSRKPHSRTARSDARPAAAAPRRRRRGRWRVNL